MIYTLFGVAVDSVRFASLNDVRRLEGGRKPDREARQAVRDRSWVIIRVDGKKEFITHIAKLRADDGLSEILKACTAVEATAAQ